MPSLSMSNVTIFFLDGFQLTGLSGVTDAVLSGRSAEQTSEL